MKDAGAAIIGIGVTTGAERAVKAVNAAINSPLLEASIDGAKGVLFSISGGRDLKMSEIQIIAKLISDTVDPGAKVIFGAYYDRRLPLKHLKVTIIATGFGFNGLAQSSKPVSLFTSYQSDPLIEARELDVKKKKSRPKKELNLKRKPKFLLFAA